MYTHVSSNTQGYVSHPKAKEVTQGTMQLSLEINVTLAVTLAMKRANYYLCR